MYTKAFLLHLIKSWEKNIKKKKKGEMEKLENKN